MEAGFKVLLMGNEAIARGAIEAGVHVVTGYPGTPSSEVIMALSQVSSEIGMKVEWFANEKVALEVALAAASAGLRSLVTMKAPGVNVAADALMSAAYCGVNGGMVILMADDPGPHTTQTEQDSRFYALMTNLPMVEPSNPQEAKDGIVWAFDLSEKLNLPVLFRTTTRVNHTSSDVVLGSVRRFDRKPVFPRDLPRYVRASMVWNLRRHIWLNERMNLAEQYANDCPLNKKIGNGKVSIVTSGVSFSYVLECLRDLDVMDDFSVYKIGMLHPLPLEMLKDAFLSSSKILIVEELEPFLESRIRALANFYGVEVEVYGKYDGLLPREGELNPSIVKSAILRFLNRSEEFVGEVKSQVSPPSRPPPMCPGCPHRATYYALLSAIRSLGYKREDVPIMGDIGCYALSLLPPLEAIWTEHCMGASISMALGLKFAGYDKPVVATIGDSTFFHAGMPALTDAVHFNVNIVVVILDNRITAMTGHQPHPGVSFRADGSPATEIDIAKLIEGMGVKNIRIIDPYDIPSSIDVFKEALENSDGPFIVIAKRECALLARRRGKVRGRIVHVDRDKCIKCRNCIVKLGCPSILWSDELGPIISNTCIGCGVCVYVCPVNALEVTENVK